VQPSRTSVCVANVRAGALADAIRPALPAILLFLLCQGVEFGALLLLSWKADVSAFDIIGRFDSAWFLSIAEQGYDQAVAVDAHGVLQQNSLVFFPLYPALIAVVMAVGVPPLAAGLLVTLLAGCTAAWGLFVLGRDLADARVGTVLAVLWSIGPGSVALHMPYSEALLVALAAWTLVLLTRRRWLPAAGLAILAGLTRAGGGAVVAAVCVAAVVAIVRRQDGWRPWVAALVAPVGLLSYLGYVALRAGRLDGWFWLQNAWQMRFDFGRFSWIQVREGLTANGSSWISLTALIVLASLALLLWSYAAKLPLSWHVYSTVTVVIALGSANYFQSRPRFLLAAFVIVVPLAVLAERLPNRVFAILVPIGAFVSGWYGAFLMEIAHMNP